MAAAILLAAPWRLLTMPLQPSAAQNQGGWTDAADLSASGSEYHLAEFALSQLQLQTTTAAANYSALEGATMVAPLVSAQTQVVSGINHKITATISVGELVLEYEQAWTGTVVVTTAKLDGEVLARDVALDYAAYTPIDESRRALQSEERGSWR
jgi:hypothetical protein